jgi:hypothetical protein
MSELDVKIATIMGPLHTGPFSHYDGFTIRDGYVFKWPEGLEWRPSERIDQAMEIVSRMRDDWFSFKCWQPSKTPYNEGDKAIEIAIVSFICGAGPCTRHGTTHQNHHGAYDVEGETLSLAICKAALIALKKG